MDPDMPAGADEQLRPTPPTQDASMLPVLASRAELATIPHEPDQSQLIDVVLGLVAVVAEAVGAVVGRSTPQKTPALDAALELTWQGWSLTTRAAGVIGRIGGPAARLVADPPLVPTSWRPVTVVRHSAAAWQQRRPTAIAAVAEARDRTVPVVVDAVVEPIDLTQLVLQRVDLGRIVEAALDQLDLTEIVLTRVDLERVVTTVLENIDLDSVARNDMDLLGLADYVVDGIDLPEIIRESTGSVASEAVRTVRMQSIDADEAVQRIVDRVLLWRRGRSVLAPNDEASDDASGNTNVPDGHKESS